ncbi:phosphatidate cytidylyltransferase [Rhodoferax sp. AJA081-3]|uniref:phosphatidate cytidylyltransferase n=1 Tax=Rhodoferax sp. AJA081-3 TaxID=2752316 RepID=UPI001AE02C87|nr:phosphatidate cytidylyltransferase [Rhodoferax sp. AJA081-3]QTN28489.1 phosphatidate cytidylyltransferase [Rhodoferax sp. AJA081-3]
MLKQRIITALLMLAVLLPAVFYPVPEVFAGVAVVLISAAAWEWARMNQSGPLASLAIGGVCAAVCLLSWYGGLLYVPLKSLWIVAGSAWVLLGAWLLYRGVAVWGCVPRSLRLVGGVLTLWVAWIAVAQARIEGINFLFSIFVLVWAADIFAYFAGRALGGKFFSRKLAPSISPGKTWEGAFGGMLGVLVCAVVWRSLDASMSLGAASLYTRLGVVHVAFMVLALLFLATMSIVGDLVESLFKRSAGIKDSSGLLPGHGGVLDRVDALLPILPLAMMFSTL